MTQSRGDSVFRDSARVAGPTRFRVVVSLKTLLAMLILAVLYALAGRFGQLIAIPPGFATPVWLPSGIALAALLLHGYRLWPGIWLGSMIVNIWAFFEPTSTSPVMRSLLVGTLLGTGASLQAIAGTYIVRTVIDSGGPCDKAKNVFKFAVFGGGVACVIGATVGVTSLALSGIIDWGYYGYTWLTWWLGDTAGVIVAGPLLLMWYSNRKSLSRWELAELMLMLAIIVVVGMLAFGGAVTSVHARLVLAYATIPLLIWPAVRFGQRETMSAAFALTLVATLCYRENFDPRTAEGHSLVLVLQGLIGIVTITALALAADIAHRKRTAVSLKKYKVAALSTADHWMITDLRGVIREVNPSFLGLTGYSQDEVVGQKASILKSGVHDRPFYDEMWRTIMEGKSYRGVVVNRKKNGEFFHELKTITPIRNAKGRIVRLLSLGKDVTEFKRKEQELVDTAHNLEKANQKLLASDQALIRQVEILQSVFTAMNEGVVVADKDGRLVMFNDAAEKMTGIGATDAHPEDWPATYGTYLTDGETLVPPEELPLVRAIAGESTDDFEMIVRNAESPEGTWLRVSGCPLRGEDGELSGGLVVLHDVTDEKRAEKAENELRISRAELEIAGRIQQQFLPDSAPKLAGFDIAGASKSATATGGDYFDYITMPDGSLLVLVGDVSGHGLGPALLMASVRGHVRALVETGLPPGEVLRITNGLIRNETNSESFVTMFAAHFDPKSVSFEYISAGHTTAYVLGSDWVVKEEMKSSFLPLGVLPDFSPEAPPAVQLGTGDTVLMLTDGVVEAERRNGSFYGEERVIDTIRRNGHKAASDVVHGLFADLEEWKGCPEFEDDVTVVVVRRV